MRLHQDWPSKWEGLWAAAEIANKIASGNVDVNDLIFMSASGSEGY